MLLLGLLVWWLVLGGVSGGELAGADSWLLMVEAGRDGPGRRITPKSVFIAPAIIPRAERCRPGFRYDHLGRCVKVVRVDPQAQLELLLKRLQGAHAQKVPSKPMPPPSGGPLQFSLPLEGFPPEPESTTQTPTTSTITAPMKIIETRSPTFSTPTTFVEPTTTETAVKDLDYPETTPETTTHQVPTTEDETKETTTEEAPSSVTWWEDLVQTTTNKPSTSDYEGSGTTKQEEGSGESSTIEGSGFNTTETTESSFLLPIEGSGSEPDVTTVSTTTLEEDREIRSTVPVPEVTPVPEMSTSPTIPTETEVSTMPTIPTAPLEIQSEEEHKPIPPNDTTASLLLSVLKGEREVEVQKSTDPPQEPYSDNVESTRKETTTEQLPLIEYIDLVIPRRDEEPEKEDKDEDRVLIPLDGIKFNITTVSDKLQYEPHTQQPEVVTPPTPRPATHTSFYSSEVVHPPWPKWMEPTTQRTFPKVDSVQVSDNKFMDNWWSETLPFDPSWVRFPDELYTQGQGNRRGPIPTSRDEVAYTPPVPMKPSRFRFPEESVNPAHRPVILKFWSKIPMLREDTGNQRHYDSEENHWTGP